jgi:hypothetical protein
LIADRISMNPPVWNLSQSCSDMPDVSGKKSLTELIVIVSRSIQRQESERENLTES